MKLEEQVTSLELSKRLKELGAKQESLFWWVKGVRGWQVVYGKNFPIDMQHCSAFTASELGEMLPWRIEGDFRFKEYKTEKQWQVCYWDLDMNLTHDEFADTEANARAKLLVYLLENKLI